MPTYEYRCTECGHTFDIVQSFTDDALTECPECSGRLKKVFGSVGIAFKGSGFYVNDSSGRKSTTSGGDSSASSGDSSSSSSDSGSTSSESTKATASTSASSTSSD